MANKRAEFHKYAEAEYRATLGWYLERSEIAAQKFAVEIKRAIERIQENPQRWPEYLLKTRRFSFGIIHFPSFTANNCQRFKSLLLRI